MDKIFPDEFSGLRNSGKKFVYLGQFAVSASYTCTRLSLRMLREVWSVAKSQGIDKGVCVVHPGHLKTYLRFGFTEIARSTIPELDHAPAALLVIERHAVRL
jgi:predicted N-acetyltransferase YhbS